MNYYLNEIKACGDVQTKSFYIISDEEAGLYRLESSGVPEFCCRVDGNLKAIRKCINGFAFRVKSVGYSEEIWAIYAKNNNLFIVAGNNEYEFSSVKIKAKRIFNYIKIEIEAIDGRIERTIIVSPLRFLFVDPGESYDFVCPALAMLTFLKQYSNLEELCSQLNIGLGVFVMPCYA